MGEMLERVARAICCPEGCSGDTGSGKPCAIAAEDRTSILQARAAIEAMMEPSEGMIDAAGDFHNDGKWDASDASLFGGIYRAMLTAALKE